MSASKAAPDERPASSAGRAIDAALAVTAIAGWILFGAIAGASHDWLVVALAATTTTLALFRPWCRRLARRSVDTATWAMHREREHATASARQHEAIWQAIVNTATEGIITIGADGDIETVNGAAEKLFGYRAAELIGKNVKVLMPEPFFSEHDGYLTRYRRTGEARIIGIGREVLARRKDGKLFPIDLSVGEGAIGGRVFFTSIIRDMTEQKELQSKLAQSERLAAVGELAAGVAHEINNPVNTMINCAQLVSDGDDAADNARIIIEEGERIAEIVKALLQFARDDSDKPQPTSLAEVVQRTQRLIGESWTRHGIALSLEIADDLPMIHARPQRLQQVLLNLLINAKDALLDRDVQPREVALSARVARDGVRFSVADNGPGIDPNVIGQVFDPFVTTKRARGGSGLGLSVSRSIVEGYGGEISCRNRPTGGAEFEIWLPLAVAD